MEKSPLVSIIIACKNNWKYIQESLESVKNQTYPNIELIIVDNFSSDWTFEIAKEYTDKVYQLGPERSTQFNFWFKQSTWDIIYRIWAEFVIEHDLVAKGVKKIMTDWYDALALHNRSIWNSIWAKVRYVERESYKDSNEIVAVRFMKRNVFEWVWMFNEELVAGEDFDLHNRIVIAWYKWCHLNAIEDHIWEPKNIIDVWNKFYYYWRTIKKYQKYNQWIAKKQLVFFRPSFKKLQKDLIKTPFLFLVFWFYMFIKYFAWFCWMLRWYPKELLTVNKNKWSQ